jgi:deazaflavin-dependent oxidoreductase (nitroreductase family)
MGVYQRTMSRLSTTSSLRWVVSRVISPLDMRLKGTRFAPSTFGVEFPLCFLTTTGRRSGEERTVPLLFACTPIGSPAIVASNFGQQNHPGWALNLQADPIASLEIDGQSRPVVARLATEEELSTVWALFDGFWRGYKEYREIAPRAIKVFILEESMYPPAS